MVFLFQNLRVYQQAIELANRLSNLTSSFSRSNWYLAEQLNRASLSIALNIAESTGRFTTADKRRFLIMARGSVHECIALLDMCDKKKLLSNEIRAELREQLIAIAKMLAGMIKNNNNFVREELGLYDVQ